MLISLDNPVLLEVIETLERRDLYTHFLWGRCLSSLQEMLQKCRQAGSIYIDGNEFFAPLDETIYTVRRETYTEDDFIEFAQDMFDRNERILPSGFYINRLLRQFGINTAAIPTPEGEEYTHPENLFFWPEMFVPSSFRSRLDSVVFKLFEEIHQLLGYQDQLEDDIREHLLAQDRAGDYIRERLAQAGVEDDSWTMSLEFRARDYRVYGLMARLVRLNGNEQLLRRMEHLVEVLIPDILD